jgi:uncharacterized protein YneF (UPF0154 family)
MKNLKVILVLVLVFCAGFAGGVVVTRSSVRHFVRNAIANPELVQRRIEQDLDRRLRLDPKQRQEVHRILMSSHRDMQELRREFQPRFGEILERARNNISAVLTPEQQQRFERFQLENRMNLKSRPPREQARD